MLMRKVLHDELKPERMLVGQSVEDLNSQLITLFNDLYEHFHNLGYKKLEIQEIIADAYWDVLGRIIDTHNFYAERKE